MADNLVQLEISFASGGVDADTVITDISPLSDIQQAFESLDSSPTALKSLIRVEG